MSDLQQEAADYAELKMDGCNVGGLRSARSAKGPQQLMLERPVFRLATQHQAAHHLRAQRGAEDGCHSSLSGSSFPLTVKSSDFVCGNYECLGPNLSFDLCGDHSVHKRVRHNLYDYER